LLVGLLFFWIPVFVYLHAAKTIGLSKAKTRLEPGLRFEADVGLEARLHPEVVFPGCQEESVVCLYASDCESEISAWVDEST
jgi:hypothetical protein